MTYLGLTTEEWAAARLRHTERSLDSEDFSTDSAIVWMALRAAECRADGASYEEAVKQAIDEVFQEAEA